MDICALFRNEGKKGGEYSENLSQKITECEKKAGAAKTDRDEPALFFAGPVLRPAGTGGNQPVRLGRKVGVGRTHGGVNDKNGLFEVVAARVAHHDYLFVESADHPVTPPCSFKFLFKQIAKVLWMNQGTLCVQKTWKKFRIKANFPRHCHWLLGVI